MAAEPIILNPGSFTAAELAEFKKTHKIWKIVDIYGQQVKELAEIYHPGKDNPGQKEFIAKKPATDLDGTWIYYPWSGVLLHCAVEEDLYKLRTNRNQNLITQQEQSTLADATVAVAGMSVGSGIALACVYSGMSGTIKIADYDTLETANLNRLREKLSVVGASKSELTAQHIYEINPFASVREFGRLTDNNLQNFVEKVAVVFDEIDDFAMKIQLRLTAKNSGIPVIMLTSLGDNILVDIERYDLDKNLPLFNGLLGELPEEILHAHIGEKEKVKYAMQLVGLDYIPTRALGSLLEINRSLVGRPQLYSTVAIDGGVGAYLARKIILGQALPSGRSYVSLDKILALSIEKDDRRDEIVKKLKEVTS